MKNLFPFIVAMLITGTALAADSFVLQSDNVFSGATVTVTSGKLEGGFLESVYVDIQSARTTTVVIADATGLVLFTNKVTADTLFRPRYPVDSPAGTLYTTATATNVVTRHFLCQETLAVTLSTSQTNTSSSVRVTVKIDDR